MTKNEQNQVKTRLYIIKCFLKSIYENKILTLPVLVHYLSGIFAVIIYRLSLSNYAAADFFKDYPGFAFRFILTSITYYIPFSLGEFILFISVPFAVFMLVKFILKIKRANYKLREFFKGLCRFAAFLCGFIIIFVFTLGVSYGAVPVYNNIGLERRLISADDLVYAMQILIEEANAEAENINYIYDTGSTKMPYGLKELNKRLNQSYINLYEKYNFIKLINARAKPVIISEMLTRMHITGVYSFFTGEANININFPDYNLPFTAAHEMAHLMGIAREDEANFTAFLVCLYSDDSYIRYSGLVKMIEYLNSSLHHALASVGKYDAYLEITSRLSGVIINEIHAFRNFFDKYRNEPIAQLSSAVNDAYLKAQSSGRDEDERDLGVATYGLVRDLAAAYIRDIYKK